MGLQFAIDVRNARLDAIATVVGASSKLRIYDGAQPANCAASETGTKLAEMILPATPFAAADAAAMSKAGSWQDLHADATGTAGHWRIYVGTACKLQGSVTVTSGGGQLELDDVHLVLGEAVVITAFTIHDGNA